MRNYILESLSDEELLVIAKNTDINLLLKPIKQKNKYYAQYISSLGRPDKKICTCKEKFTFLFCQALIY